MSPLHVRSKVCLAPFHVRSKVCIAPHMEGNHADFAPHMKRRHSFKDQKMAIISISAKEEKIIPSTLYLRDLYGLSDHYCQASSLPYADIFKSLNSRLFFLIFVVVVCFLKYSS